MKFKDPNTGKVFDSIFLAHQAFCITKSTRECFQNKCQLGYFKNGIGRNCIVYCNEYPADAARLMGYEVIDCKACANVGRPLYMGPCSECHDYSKFEPKEVNMEKKDKPTTDAVDHSAHYNQGSVERIDAIKAAVSGLDGIRAFCAGNAIKYIWRFKDKNGVQDLEKAEWYIKRLKEEMKNG